MHKVTIAIPLYNAEDYIETALASALKQTLKDIEILIINDCSTDRSLSIVEKMRMQNKGHSIRIISLSSNKGIGAVRNIAIIEAQSKYLFFLDSDDSISEQCLEQMYNKAEEIQADTVFASTKKIYKDHTEEEISANRSFTRWGDFQLFCYTQHGIYLHTVWNKLYNLNFIRSHNLTFKEIRKSEDCLFINALVPCITKCATLSDITYHYLIRDNSLCQYNARSIIPIEEIKIHLEVASELNQISKQYKSAPFGEYLTNEHMNFALDVVFAIFDKWKIISEPVSAKEIKAVLRHPYPFMEICRFKYKRFRNLWLYIFARLPFSIIKQTGTFYYRFIKLYRKMRCP